MWSLLRQRLEKTEPTEFEDRPSFLLRLRRTVQWLNANQSDALLSMCINQKARAHDVMRLEGARTQW